MKRRINGYSLIELLIVFGVFFAILTIAGPKITELVDKIKGINNIDTNQLSEIFSTLTKKN
jgi:type II secretory pathway pseudopilin PulG